MTISTMIPAIKNPTEIKLPITAESRRTRIDEITNETCVNFLSIYIVRWAADIKKDIAVIPMRKISNLKKSASRLKVNSNFLRFMAMLINRIISSSHFIVIIQKVNLVKCQIGPRSSFLIFPPLV